MKILKRICLFTLSLTLSLHLAVSQAAERETIEELLQVMDADSMIDNMYTQMGQAFRGMGQQMGLDPANEELFDEYMNDIVALMRKEMTWESIKEPMIDLYSTHYTDKEIQDMLSFYRSETGQSLLKKMPLVMAESVKISQQMVIDIMPQIQELAQDYVTKASQTDADATDKQTDDAEE